MKDVLKWFFIPIAIFLSISLGIGLLAEGVKSLLGSFKIDFGENWRETVSTDNGIKGTTNGGLTIKEIEKFEELAVGMPYYSDIFKKSIVVESDNYVTIYRQIDGTTDYYNLNFVKAKNGLVYDGAVGVETNVPVNWLTGFRDISRAKTTLDLDITTAVYNNVEYNAWDYIYRGILSLHSLFQNNSTDNIVTFSDFKTSFAPGFDNVNNIAAIWTNDSAKKDLFLYITEYLATNVMHPHFQTLTDNATDISIELKTGIENINNPEVVKQKLNTFATYLWKNAKSEDKTNKSTIVDVSNYYTSLIPENLQSNYLIENEEDKLTFADFDYYPMYDNSIFFDTLYTYTDNQPIRDNKKIQEDKDVEKDDSNIGIVDKQQTEYTKLQLILNNKNNSNIDSVNLVVNPVLIEINDRVIVVNSKHNFIQQIAIPINTTVNWKLNSTKFLFDSYSGVFEVGENFATKTFDFSYYNNRLPVKFSLHPILGLDISDIDLSKTPVTIALVNTETSETITYRFNKNSQLQSGITQLLLPGDYNFTIVSSSLKFNDYEGNITITDITREILQTFWIEEENAELKLSYTHSQSFILIEDVAFDPFYKIYFNDTIANNFKSFKIYFFDIETNEVLDFKEFVSLDLFEEDFWDAAGEKIYFYEIYLKYNSSMDVKMGIQKTYNVQFVYENDLGNIYSLITEFQPYWNTSGSGNETYYNYSSIGIVLG